MPLNLTVFWCWCKCTRFLHQASLEQPTVLLGPRWVLSHSELSYGLWSKSLTCKLPTTYSVTIYFTLPTKCWSLLIPDDNSHWSTLKQYIFSASQLLYRSHYSHYLRVPAAVEWKLFITNANQHYVFHLVLFYSKSIV